MQGKILGVPLVLLVLVILILLPLVAFDLKMSQQLTKVQTACTTALTPVIMEEMPATPSATPTFKHAVAPATSSGK